MLFYPKTRDIMHAHVMQFAASRLTAKPVWGELSELLAQISTDCEERGLAPPTSDALRAHILQYAPEINRRYSLQNKPGRKKLLARVEVLIQQTLEEAQPAFDDLKVIWSFDKVSQQCAAENLPLASYYIVRKRTEEYLLARGICRPKVPLDHELSSEHHEDIPVLRHALKELDELRAYMRHIMRTRQAKLDRLERSKKQDNEGVGADHGSQP